MWWIIAIISSVCTVEQSAVTKAAPTKDKSDLSLRFNALKIGAAFVFFLLLSIYKISFHLPTVLFAAAYGTALFFSTVFGFLALKNGSMALTSLIVSYSVIIPCFFGIVFLHEPASFNRLAGLVLLVLSMFLLKKRSDGVSINKKWLFCVTVTFLCNGICSVIQKTHQTLYPSLYCNEFMLFSLMVSFVIFLALSFAKKSKKSPGTAKYAVVSGVLLGLGNYLTLVLLSGVDASVLFPVISAASMFLNVIISRLCFKDRLNIVQIAGIILGVFSVLLIK